jgi:polyisoprenoid-binding protein YceI
MEHGANPTDFASPAVTASPAATASRAVTTPPAVSQAAPLQTLLRAGTWSVDDQRTRVCLSVPNMIWGTVHGTVAVAGADVLVSQDGQVQEVRAEIDLSSVDTGVARRDADLRKPTLLDIDHHPMMVFRSQHIDSQEHGWAVHGDLEVRGTTVPLTLTVAQADEESATALHVVATAELDRRSAGIRAPAFLIGHKVSITVDAWLDAP